MSGGLCKEHVRRFINASTALAGEFIGILSGENLRMKSSWRQPSVTENDACCYSANNTTVLFILPSAYQGPQLSVGDGVVCGRKRQWLI